jgi:hypothetical protein
MRNLDIQDTRAKLGIYTQTGLLGGGGDDADATVPLLTGPPKTRGTEGEQTARATRQSTR